MTVARSYQPSLFDAPACEPAIVMDIVKGRQLRDAGIEKAELHAEQQTPGWKEAAYELLLDFISKQHSPFMTEDVREYARLINFTLPPNARAWGGVVLKAARAGLIERIGIKQVKNKNAHCANAALWARR